MDEQTQKRETESPSRFRRESPLDSGFHALIPSPHRLGSFGIDLEMTRPLAEAETPLPNIDDDLSMQKYISDRRVIGV
jgi:hypothetical protein